MTDLEKRFLAQAKERVKVRKASGIRDGEGRGLNECETKKRDRPRPGFQTTTETD